MFLGTFHCQGVSLIWIVEVQGLATLVADVDLGCFGSFYRLSYLNFHYFLSLVDGSISAEILSQMTAR